MSGVRRNDVTRSMARTAHLVLAWLFVAGVAVQIFLAGMGVFAGSLNFATHRDFGYLLELFPVLLLVTAAVGRLGRRQVILPVVIFGLFVLQSILVLQRDSFPAIAALHPVNGFLIALLAVGVAREAWQRWRSGEPEVAAPAGAQEAAGS